MTTLYDQVAYPGQTISTTGINGLGAIARLLGIPAASPEKARVLELGCGDGTNLIAQAFYWPNARFVGVDLASTAIEDARATAATLGLANVRFEVANIATMTPDAFGRFDYVIAHGVYSWVSPAVRDALLAVIAGSLAQSGVGYVSYNAMPGCRIRHVVRDLLRFTLHRAPVTPEIIGPAWETLRGISALPEQAAGGFLAMLAREAGFAQESGPGFLFHDDLSEYNDPCHLYEFAAHAARSGLVVPGDASMESMAEPGQDPAVLAWIDGVADGDWIGRLQAIDFVLGTRFRRSLLAHGTGLPPAGWSQQALAEASWMSDLVPEGAVRIDDDSEALFARHDRKGARTNHPLIKAALLALHASPGGTMGTRAFAQRLLAADPGMQPGTAIETAASVLHGLGKAGLIHPVLTTPPARDAWLYGADSRPVLNTLARRALQAGQPLVDSAHRSLKLDESWLDQLALAMDGSRDISALARLALSLADAARAPGADEAAASPALAERGVASLLDLLARRGLLQPTH